MTPLSRAPAEVPVPSSPPKMDDRTAQWLPWLVAMSFFMQMLDGTILNTALPAIAKSLNEDPLRVQALVISYLLTQAIGIPASGWLTDRWGPRSLMSAAMGLFALGSLMCALSTNLYFMVGARIIQGAGGALMMPVGRLVVLRLYPKNDLMRVMSIIPIPGLFGNLIGPALGGFLVVYASWHWIFLINLPVALIGIVANLRLMPRFEPDRERPFDFPGFCVFGLSLVLITLAIEGISRPNVSAAMAVLLAAGGLALQAAYWLWIAKRPVALFRPSVFKVPTFRVGLAANLFTRLGTGATPFLLPLLLQVVLGYSALKAGLMIMPMALASVLAKLMARPLSARFQSRSILLANTFLQGALIAALSMIPLDLNPLLFCLHLAALGAINSIQFAFLNTYTLADLSYQDSGSGNALMSVVMQLSFSLAVGLAAASLHLFQEKAGANPDPALILPAFKYTFMALGGVSIVSAVLFFFGPRK